MNPFPHRPSGHASEECDDTDMTGAHTGERGGGGDPEHDEEQERRASPTQDTFAVQGSSDDRLTHGDPPKSGYETEISGRFRDVSATSSGGWRWFRCCEVLRGAAGCCRVRRGAWCCRVRTPQHPQHLAPAAPR